nr:hypothetical protein [Cytophagales bacterium]
MKNTIIYLIGFPGTGKYTIAKEIAALENFIIVDNHLINNPVFSLVELDGKTKLPSRIWDNVEQIWDAVLDTMVYVSPKEYNFVLTNALFDDNEEDHAFYKKIENMACARESKFVPVILSCSAPELQRRIVSKDRALRLKEVCAEAALHYHENEKVLQPENDYLFEMDITSLTPAEVAKRILDHVKTNAV